MSSPILILSDKYLIIILGDKKMAFIYSIYNIITKKRYIGETLCLEDR